MAEDQGKEEEKFEFDSAGEALAYISLAQARVVAMQTARETPGEYGSQYQSVSMAFQAVESSCRLGRGDGQASDHWAIFADSTLTATVAAVDKSSSHY